jgi:predicted permease
VFPTGELPDILQPAALSAADSAGRNESTAIGLLRLPAGMTLDEITPRLDESTRRAQRPDLPERSRFIGASVRTLDDLGLAYRRSFRQLAGVAGTLMLLACVAVATLASGRARQQERQTLVRRALGATSWNLFRAALSEAALLTGTGAALGLTLAPMALALTLALMPIQDQFVKAPAIDARAAALVAAVALLTAVVTALASVRSSNRASLVAGAATGTTRPVRHFGRALIGTQIALAFVLTLGGTLGAASLWRAWAIDPGYEPAGLALVEVNVRTPNLRGVVPVLDQLTSALAELPDVTVGLFGGHMLGGGWSVATARSHADAPEVELQLVQAGGALFEVLGLTAIEGRLPSRDEVARGDDVVVLSDRAARTFWPGGSAVGRSLLFPQSAATIIGVVHEPQFTGLASGPTEAGQVYLTRGGRRDTTFLLRTTGSTQAALDGARRIVAATGADVDVIRAVTMHDALADSIKSRRLAAWLHGGFAFSSLIIVGTAVLGLVAMATSLRAREFGIRQALGARREGLIAMLVREQLVSVVMGLGAGVLAAYWFQGLLRGAVSGVAPTDYTLWFVAAATITSMAMLGVLVPAVRSTRVDPVVSLRVE